jgi:hypothetical protein
MARMTTLSGVKGLNRALRRLPKDAKDELTDASKDIAGDVASAAKNKAAGLQTKIGGWVYLGPTFRADKSSKPSVKMGGRRRIPGRRGDSQTVGDLLWGLEFGGGARPTTQQFLPHKGTEGYALWPTVREKSEETGQRYSDALMQALEKMA